MVVMGRVSHIHTLITEALEAAYSNDLILKEKAQATARVPQSEPQDIPWQKEVEVLTSLLNQISLTEGSAAEKFQKVRFHF